MSALLKQRVRHPGWGVPHSLDECYCTFCNECLSESAWHTVQPLGDCLNTVHQGSPISWSRITTLNSARACVKFYMCAAGDKVEQSATHRQADLFEAFAAFEGMDEET